MAATLDATVGGASANSYVTLAEANAYLDERLNASAWATASNDSRIRSLREAVRELEDMPWVGVKAADTQALHWPRDNAPDPDATISDPATDFPFYASTVVPQRVKDAQIELALEFLRAGTTDLAKHDGTVGVVRKKVGPLETEWERASARPQGMERFPRVMSRIGPLLAGFGAVIRV